MEGFNRMKCDHVPTAVHIYGVYEFAGIPRDTPMNEVQLCDLCGKQFWENIKGSVMAQHMHYEVKPINHGIQT